MRHLSPRLTQLFQRSTRGMEQASRKARQWLPSNTGTMEEDAASSSGAGDDRANPRPGNRNPLSRLMIDFCMALLPSTVPARQTSVTMSIRFAHLQDQMLRTRPSSTSFSSAAVASPHRDGTSNPPRCSLDHAVIEPLGEWQLTAKFGPKPDGLFPAHCGYSRTAASGTPGTLVRGQ